MMLACSKINLAVVFSILTIVITIFGIYYAHKNARTTQKITLIDRRVEVYLILMALVNTLEDLFKKIKNNFPKECAEFAADWCLLLQENEDVKKIYKSSNINVSTLTLLSLKTLISSRFVASHYFFSKQGVAEGVDCILELLELYGKSHNGYGGVSMPFTIDHLNALEKNIKKGRHSMKKMEKEMEIK